MTAGNTPILSMLIFIPLLGALLLYVFPIFHSKNDQEGHYARWFSILITFFNFILSLFLWSNFNIHYGGMQFIENKAWISSFGIKYYLGVDGISLLLVLLTTFLMPIVCLASYSVQNKIRGYLFNMLVLESAMIGTFLALDLFLFYIFWELMLFPMYFIIGIWGGKRKIYATLKFVLFTVFGSIFMLIGIFYIVWAYYQQSGVLTFDLYQLLAESRVTIKEQIFLFLGFALAFGIKVPIFPFHTWLPDAHVEAPTGGSVILAGVLLKMGLYGFIRFAYPLFPEAAHLFTPLIAFLAVIGIIYGALVAWAQEDIKKLVAYSSVSHLGYCVLGFVAFNYLSSAGSIYQMLNHGISTGALFLLVGVLYDRRHTREIIEYGGLAKQVPIFAFFFMVFTFSSIALPLTNGFIGEFLILAGSFQTLPLFAVLAVSGVVLGAVYMLTLYLKTMFGKLDENKNGSLSDMNLREVISLTPLFIMVFIMGIFPQPFLRVMEPAINKYFNDYKQREEMLIRPTDKENMNKFYNQVALKNTKLNIKG